MCQLHPNPVTVPGGSTRSRCRICREAEKQTFLSKRQKQMKRGEEKRGRDYGASYRQGGNQPCHVRSEGLQKHTLRTPSLLVLAKQTAL